MKKIPGKKIVTADTSEPGNMFDLMEALQKSLAARTFSIILGKYHNGAYLYKGHVTLGVTTAAVSQLKESGVMPFAAIPAGEGNESAVWVYPDQVCTVEYMPNTKNSLRQAVFKGFRTDMVPEDID